VPTDDTLVRNSDGSVTPKAATVDLRMSGGGNNRFASIERAGRRYALNWPGALPPPRLWNAARFPDNVFSVFHAANVSSVRPLRTSNGVL
jgi:hypothetical protein